MTKVNTTNELTLKDQKLPRGARRKIAQKFGVTEDYVSKVKNGLRNNLDIVEAMIDAIEAHHKREAEIRKRAANI
jgi:ribosomal protein S5